MNISVVVPLFNEEESLSELFKTKGLQLNHHIPKPNILSLLGPCLIFQPAQPFAESRGFSCNQNQSHQIW